MDILEQIKAECEKNEAYCIGCNFIGVHGCLLYGKPPKYWNIEEIKKRRETLPSFTDK